jgi:polar amino acid transport system substrate-binding protein
MGQNIKAVTVLNSKSPKAKKIVRLTLPLFFLTGAIMSTINHAATLKVCYDQWAPMTIFPSEGSPERGVVIDMLKQIYTPKGYQLEFYEVPLARGLALVAEGLCDMLPEYLSSKNSEKDFVYASEVTFAYTTAFVVRQDDPWRYNGIQSMKGKRIATGPGWDSYADNDLVLQHILNRLNLNDDLKIVRPGLKKKMYQMPIFSKKIPTAKRQALIKIWDEGRLSMKGKKVKIILKKYNVTFEG